MSGQAQWASQLRRRKQRTERGAVFVELAFFATMLVTLALGLAEYGNLFGSAIDTSLGVRSAVSAAAATTDLPAPDKDIITAALDQRGGKKRQIDRIVVYKPVAGQAGPPGACLTTAENIIAGQCNVYFPKDFAKSEAEIASLSLGGWPAENRIPGQDLIGVWVGIKQNPIQSLVWSPGKYSDYEVMLVGGTVLPADSSPSNTGGFSPGPQSIAPYDFSVVQATGTYSGDPYTGGGIGGGSGSL